MRGECGIGSIMKELGDAEKQRNSAPIKRSVVDVFGAIFMICVFGVIGIIDFLFGEKKQSQKSKINDIPYKIEPRS